nr:hypothetical protein GCM10017544_20130 [Microbacterium imperiale]
MTVDEKEMPVDGRGLQGVVQTALDTALRVQADLIEKNLIRARQRNPNGTPSEAIMSLERMYRSALTGTGAGVGAAAAAPGVGTGAALVLAGGEALTSLELSTLFALSVAHIHGVRVDEIERRRTLIMGILAGGGSTEMIKRVAQRTGPHWAKTIVAKVPASQLTAINKVLGRHFITKYGTKQGIIVLGKVVPFGLGAVIGGAANLVFAETAVRATRRAFGPAPTHWRSGGEHQITPS